MRCLRCEKRNIPCNLFLAVNVAQQGPLVALGSAPDWWAGTLEDYYYASSSRNLMHHPQGERHSGWTTTTFMDNTRDYPAEKVGLGLDLPD